MSIDRHQAIHRQRRIIFNDDAGYLHRETSSTPEGFLAERLNHVAGTQVDSVWWSVSGAEVYRYDTKAGEIYGQHPVPGAPKPDLEGMALTWRNIKEFIDRGTDPLGVVIEFCRKHSLEVFPSYRMNMPKDSWRPQFWSKWKREHPELCLGERGMGQSDDDLTRVMWSALDWEHEAVHDQRLAIIEELCRDYDIDGIELDFWRWPAYFKPTLDRKPVEQRHLDAMTDFMRKTRERVTAIEAELGRPFVIAPRVFDTLEINRWLGLDVETWLEEGLLDLLIVGGHYTYYSIPVSEWAELAHKYDVPFYPCLYRSTGVEFDRAVASHFFNSGADGIYSFNLRLPEHLEPIKEIGDPDLIARRDKHYVMNPSYEGGALGIGCAPGLLPVRLTEGTPETAKLIIGDDVRKAAADDALSLIRLRLSLTNFDPRQDTLAVKLNGRELRHPQQVRPENPWAKRGKDTHDWLEEGIRSVEFAVFTLYTDVPIEPNLEVGENSVEVSLRPRASGLTGPVDIVGLELFISYQ